MSEELVVRCCAPTLASLKTGNLFTCRVESKEALYQSIRSFNRRLRHKGLRMQPLRYHDGVGLVYLYRPSKLQTDLSHETAQKLLAGHGYHCGNPACCVRRLCERIAESADFPHEIGLFLGYPPENVDGFIHRKHECKYAGLWKVYGDVENARRTFDRLRKCTDVYTRHHAQGSALEKLAVSA